MPAATPAGDPDAERPAWQERRASRREIASIATPVSLEFVLTLVVNFVNQVVVGALGATAIAAVGFANSIVFILVLTLSALGTSVSILVARAHGGGRRDQSDRVVTVAVLAAALLALAVSAPLVLSSAELMAAAGASATVTAAGSDYLRLMGVSAGPTVVAAVLGGVLRSTGHPRSPMIATLVTSVLGAVLAYGLVYGVAGLPRLGVAGAGWAALAAAVLKATILAAQVFLAHRVVTWRLTTRWLELRAVLVPLFVLAVPLGLTQIVWTTGIFLYNVVLQRLGDEQLAAAQIVTTLEGVFIVGSIGLMSATTVLVGRAVGRGDGAAARWWVARVCRSGVVTGLVFGALFAGTVVLLPVLFADVDADVHRAAALGIGINAVVQVVKVRNMILGAGVLPSGDDVRGVLRGDVVSGFVVGLPLATVLALATPLGIAGVFLARALEEVVKVAIFTGRARRLDWDRLARPHARPGATREAVTEAVGA